MLLSAVKVFYSIWPKTVLGYILVDFFTNSSGHPVLEQQNKGREEFV
jgi:hypothetical protein